MGSKGSNTYTTTTQAPEWLQSAYMGTVANAQQTAATPYVPYGGELVAGVNPQEQAGIGQINQYANWAQPYLNAAAGYAMQGAAPITQQTIQQYENPEAAAVTRATLANYEDLNAQQNQQVIGNAISSGAWGGDRAAIAQTELAKSQLQGEAPALAGINMASYNTGLQTALTEQQQQAQAAYSLGNIGSAAQSAGLTGAGAMIQGGQLQQGTQQALDQARMQQYYTALGYPFQTAAWLAGIETGVGGVAGGTSQSTAPAPNPLNTILGLGAAGAGAYMGMKRGGGGINVPHFDSGGAAGPMPYSGGIGFIPNAPSSGGRGLMNPSMMLAYHQPQGQQGQQGGGSGGLGNIGTAVGKYLGTPGGIDTSGAGAGFPLEGSADAAGLDIGAGAGEVASLAPEAAGVADAGAAAGFSMADILPFLALAARGGRIRGIGAATGGGVGLEDMWRGFADPFAGYGADLTRDPYAGDQPPIDATDITLKGATPEAVDQWRAGVDADVSHGISAQGQGDLPPEITSGTSRPPPQPRGNGPLGYAPSPGIGAASPTALNPNGGVGSSINVPSAPTGDNRSLSERLSLPLMQAGFAMMASRSPFLGEAIGQGGLSGIGAYVNQEHEQRTAQEKGQEIALKAKQISDMAEQARARIAQQEKQREVPVGYRKTADGSLEPVPGGPADPATVRARTIASGQHIVSFTDPNTGQIGFFNQITGKVETPQIGSAPAPGATPPATGPTPTPSNPQVANAEGFVVQNSKMVDAGQPFNYGRNGPVIEKGTPVPEPMPIGGRSSAAIKEAANYYLQTGKLPTGWAARAGNNPVAIQQSLAAYSAQNYAGALAESRGLDLQRLAEMWRTAPQLGRFILGPAGQQTVSLGTAMRHLDQLGDLAKAWDSGNIQLINRAKAALSREFGDASVTNLESAGKIVGPEIIKAIGIAGGGSAEERTSAGGQFSSATSPSQIMGAIKTTQGLMIGQLKGKEGQAQAMGVSPEMFKSLVGEHEYNRLREIEGGGAGGSTTLPPGIPPPEKREAGKTYIWPTGPRVWSGTGWQQPAVP